MEAGAGVSVVLSVVLVGFTAACGDREPSVSQVSSAACAEPVATAERLWSEIEAWDDAAIRDDRPAYKFKLGTFAQVLVQYPECFSAEDVASAKQALAEINTP